ARFAMAASTSTKSSTSSGTLRKVLPFLRPFRRRILFVIALTVVLSLIAMLPPLLTRAVINNVITQGQHSLFIGIAVMIFAVPIVHTVINYFQVLGVAYIGQRFVLDLRMAVYRHLLSLHIGYYSKNATGKIINLIMGDTAAIQQILNYATIQIVSDLVCSLFAITVTLYINWRLALPLVVMVVLFVANIRLSVGKIRKAYRTARASDDRLASGVQNRLVANATIKTYGTEQRENDAFEFQSDLAMDATATAWASSNVFENNIVILQDVGRIIIYFLGCAMVLSDAADYGDVTAFTAYAMQILWPAVRFSRLAGQLQNVKISADRLFEILDEIPQIASKPDAVRLERAAGKIDFDDVSFAYEPERPVLKHVDFHITPGQTVALVGATGCGKTTILSLLMRLFEVNEGAIRMDGHDLRDLRVESLRKQFGIVLQESLLFNIAVRDNIRYATPGATQEEIENAAKIAEIHDDILKLPKGYDSVIGDRNVQLSVGQRQRLSIARAVLSNPAILIMDEATSSLDSESEQAIQLAMERFLVNRTSFIVAHRLSTIRKADVIFLIDKGEIIERGNHETLMAIENGRYRDLYEKHAGKGIIASDDEVAPADTPPSVPPAHHHRRGGGGGGGGGGWGGH
ncbi:MAG: ABC transporter ATP-binding protein/permease, partial [Kiritimatiellaeota bacterium]|nr:ABC transporter ATP-binding protein/permease [Kiritimatiellota bacterium]